MTLQYTLAFVKLTIANVSILHELSIGFLVSFQERSQGLTKATVEERFQKKNQSKKREHPLLLLFVLGFEAHCRDIQVYSYIGIADKMPAHTHSFSSLASKGSPADIRKVCVCPPALRKLRTYRPFPPKQCLTNTPRSRRLAECQLSSLYSPSPSFSSCGAASVILCCFLPASSNMALPILLY